MRVRRTAKVFGAVEAAGTRRLGLTKFIGILQWGKVGTSGDTAGMAARLRETVA
jgi:hypothetical protein